MYAPAASLSRRCDECNKLSSPCKERWDVNSFRYFRVAIKPTLCRTLCSGRCTPQWHFILAWHAITPFHSCVAGYRATSSITKRL
jgi:hypothetical protein